MTPLEEIIDSALAAVGNDAGMPAAVGSALASAASAGLLLLTRQQRDLVSVLTSPFGAVQARALVSVAAEEMPFFLGIADGTMKREFPSIRIGGSVYSWDDAKKAPGSFVWYLGAVMRAAPQQFGAILRAFNASPLDGYAADFDQAYPVEMCVYGQCPATICLLIIAILGAVSAVLGLGSAVIWLVNKAYPDISPYIFPPKPAGQVATQSQTDDGKSNSAILLLLVFVFFFLSGDGAKE